ncbi:MAG: UDP-glucose 4-epimerase GalE [Rhodospirillaceae bacterium]|nr:UDP-glucose 4-epimerase GalE [Rhodospirillaceae bacterium]
MTTKTILVTGGAGYVGSHACKALAQAGFQPVVFDNLNTGHRELVKWGPLEIGDICDADAIRAVMAHYKPAAVMHFAALTVVSESVSHPARYFRTNVDGTAALLAVMRAHGVGKLIVSGTCAVYGLPADNPITETTAIAPINPYGESKLAMERLVAEAGKDGAVSSVVLRYFNAAGADPDGETGEWHEPETHLIPNVLRAAAGTGEPLKLYGEDYPTPDGTCIRDYIHVCDIADAHIAALTYLDTNPGGHIFNLGCGTGFSVRQVIDTARMVTGLPIPITIAPRRAGDSPILVANASKVKNALGWSPHATLLDQVRDAWKWEQSGKR